MNSIPPITDPMGRHWEQPPSDQILVDENYALMPEGFLKRLHDYSCTLPSGTYSGKMWRRDNNFRTGKPPEWWLCWYGDIIGKEIEIHQRQILTT